MKNSSGTIFMILASIVLFFLLPEPPPVAFGEANLSRFTPRRKSGNRLFYIYHDPDTHDLKRISRADIEYYKSRGPIYATFAPSLDHARDNVVAGKAERYRSSGNLSGNVMTCAAWQQVTDKRGREITRCMFYDPSCGKCRSDSPPKPEEAKPEEPKISQREIKALSRTLAEEANEAIYRANDLYREILDRGGIAPHRSGFLREEYQDLPDKYKRHDGLPIDEMAGELNMSEFDLVRSVENIERVRSILPKGKRKLPINYFLNQAEDMLIKQAGQPYAGIFSIAGVPMFAYPRKRAYEEKQIELFPGLKRELVLEQEDIAVSDDPLEICLERMGWNMKRVRKLQENIASKLTPDMFGKTERLTGGEIQLQENIDTCLSRFQRGYRPPKQEKSLFGSGLPYNLAELKAWQMTLDEFQNVGELQRAKAWGVLLAIRDRKTGKIYSGSKSDRLHLDILSRIKKIKIKDIESGFILPDGTFFTRWSSDSIQTPEGFRYMDEGYKSDLHRLLVERAYKEGKQVPKEILREHNIAGLPCFYCFI